MKYKIDHDGYAEQAANILTVELGADGKPQFEGPKMPNDAEARSAALKEWKKANEPAHGYGYQGCLPFHLAYLWRCEGCFEGASYSFDFPTVKLTTADDLGPCARCGCDLNKDGGAWMYLWETEDKREPPTALHVVITGVVVGYPDPHAGITDDDTPF